MGTFKAWADAIGTVGLSVSAVLDGLVPSHSFTWYLHTRNDSPKGPNLSSLTLQFTGQVLASPPLSAHPLVPTVPGVSYSLLVHGSPWVYLKQLIL